MKNRVFFWLLLLSLALLVSCGSTQEPATPTAVETVSQSPVATPVPMTAPAPTQTMGTFASPVPTPSADDGVVVGVLLRGNPPEPVQRFVLYLGDVVVQDESAPVMASVDKSTAPRSSLDPDGRFVFTQVPPGQYVLIVDTISSTLILRDPVSGDDLIVEVKAGDTVDLGELVYSDLAPAP